MRILGQNGLNFIANKYKELKNALLNKADKTDIADHKRCIILTQSEYDALSSTEKNHADTLYFIKK